MRVSDPRQLLTLPLNTPRIYVAAPPQNLAEARELTLPDAPKRGSSDTNEGNLTTYEAEDVMKLRIAFLGMLLSAASIVSTGASADGTGPGHGSLKDEVGEPPFSWTGFYVGGLASYGRGDARHCDFDCFPGYPDFDIEGGLGGFTIGYNSQNGHVVFGIEGDWSWGDVDGSSPSTSNFGCAGLCETNIESIGTVRARMGYAHGRFLVYGTAGLAISELNASIGTPALSEDTTWETSFAGGGGVEYSFTQHLSAKAEYLFIDGLGDFAYDTGACGAPPSNCFARTGHIDMVRLGLNYGF